MKLLSERTQVRDVAERWKANYFSRGEWHDTLKGSSAAIHASLASLDPETASAGDAASIIGNHVWVCAHDCHECGQKSWNTVLLGQEPGYDSNTAVICVDCLRKAVKLVESETGS